MKVKQEKMEIALFLKINIRWTYQPKNYFKLWSRRELSIDMAVLGVS